MPLQHILTTMLGILATESLTSLDSLTESEITHNNQPPKTSCSTWENVTLTFLP